MANQFIEMYKRKKVTVEEVLSKIHSNDKLGIAASAMEPLTILSQLHTIQDRVKNVNVLITATMGQHEFMLNPDLKESFTVDSLFFMGAHRMSYNNGVISYQPNNLHNCAERRLDYKAPNVFIGSATPMDKNGYVRLSLSLFLDKDLLEKADLVILEINPNMPALAGDTEVHIRDIDYLVEVDTPIPGMEPGVLSDVDNTIGQYVASLVNDGDTIQLGIGGIPDAAAQMLMNKKDLGIHTELITNSMADLIEAGVVTNKRKTINVGKTVGTFVFGSQRLYDFLDENPSIMMKRGSYTNDLSIIAQHDNMVSINSAIQVDLTGQICSESMGTRHWSGTGGQNDFGYGAIHSRNGKSIIALKSTAKKGTVSTIQPVLNPGAIVTMSRNNIDYIVTEYGIAYLKGRTIRERVENLIAVAHPDFRAQLKQEAKKYDIR